YLYERDGRLVRQITRGDWDVTTVIGVDTVSSVLYYAAASESPMGRAILATDLDDAGRARLVSGGRGMRSASFSPDFRFFLETSSTVSEPPTIALRDRAGAVIRVIEDNRRLQERLDQLELREPEFLTVRAGDGTILNAVIMKPRDFDPGREYPLLVYVYGGPGSQTVRDGWGGERYLWHQLLVQNGVLVASVDNRGTGARGREFKQQVYLRLGQLEAADQLAAVRQFAEYAFIDPSRIGIWGWSYGGYLSLMTTLLSDGEIAAAVAVAPVTHWKFYDTAYTERFMRTPLDNPDGYRLGAPLTYADRLGSPLLIVHGTGDDNVHPQHTTEMTRALIDAGRPFEMQLYPNRTHSIRGGGARVHLFERITDFVMDNLLPAATDEPGPPRLDTGLFQD
ncbi:MAG: prolyl oligopeptidase family serine peptidase, partial [Gemmatimonadota bacterium]